MDRTEDRAATERGGGEGVAKSGFVGRCRGEVFSTYDGGGENCCKMKRRLFLG